MFLGLLGAGLFGASALNDMAIRENMDKYSICMAKGEARLTYKDSDNRDRFIPTGDYCIIDGNTRMGNKDQKIIKEGKRGGRLGELLNVNQMYRSIACEEAKHKGIRYITLQYKNIETPMKLHNLCYDVYDNKHYVYKEVGAYELSEKERERGETAGIWNGIKELRDKKVPVYVEIDIANGLYKCGRINEYDEIVKWVGFKKFIELYKNEIEDDDSIFEGEHHYRWKFDLMNGIELYNNIEDSIETNGRLSDYYIETERHDLIQEYLDKKFRK